MYLHISILQKQNDCIVLFIMVRTPSFKYCYMSKKLCDEILFLFLKAVIWEFSIAIIKSTLINIKKLLSQY